MANETTNEAVNVVNNLMDVVGKLAQQQIELITCGIKSVSEAIEPLSKNTAELAGNVINACNQMLTSVTESITPNK
ncbi:chlorosome envelope protein B [Chlorobium sp. BLA1]|uniref:chlorosome envelope protein B n=1 Tax=Candidatus Chlorobium masyuteum TaxID=2716876 RepID=UPI00141ECAD6|nr:chlorosome envelope protein B [Candidatus Chlorobium masyuteum]NHQ60711.1 chlorosome envelope protein B [Candidatus Chlorobium masyuteum]NTU45346.1 chlorosome envelope protein B [Chlorobiaceae bacterium]